MKPNELRLGNIFQAGYVTATVGEITASGITFDALDGSICVGLCDLSIAKTVKLTDEWLSKLGGVKSEANKNITWSFPSNGYSEFDIARHVESDIYCFRVHYLEFADGEEEPTTENLIIRRVDYVHQLQNLFYALTGEELNLTP